MQTQSNPLPSVAERSPLEYFHGLYARDAIGYGGAMAFSWFADDAEALTYLREGLVLLYLDAEEEAEEVQAVNEAITAALHEVHTLKAVNLGAVNERLAGLCELLWAGSLDDLRTGEMAFERVVQDDFEQNTFGDERGQTDSEWDDFVQHLSHYNG